MPSNQRQIIEQAKSAYSPLGKYVEKQTKTIEDQGIKQVGAVKALSAEKQELKSIAGLFQKNMRTNEVKYEIDEVRKWNEEIKGKDLTYKTNKYLYDSQKSETIRSSGDSIHTRKIKYRWGWDGSKKSIRKYGKI